MTLAAFSDFPHNKTAAAAQPGFAGFYFTEIHRGLGGCGE
jgi:hypothetical protein